MKGILTLVTRYEVGAGGGKDNFIVTNAPSIAWQMKTFLSNFKFIWINKDNLGLGLPVSHSERKS